jgi:hypothetical protein
MAIFDLWLSRNNGPTLSNYVGHSGRLFFDPVERVLRISDGVTPGGEVFNGIVTVANTEPTANFLGQIWLNQDTYELSVYHNGDFIPTIDVATTTKLGGVKLGPGVTVNGDGQIIIDSEGLDFSFGDFAATVGTYPADYYESARRNDDYAVLGSVKTNEDIVLASNGTGAVRVVGDFSVRRANGNLVSALEEEPIFRVKGDGQVQLLVPAADSAEGAFTIVGGFEGVFQAPVNTGVMMHITGIASSPDPTPSRIYNDAQNSFSAIVSRRYNGTAAAPSAVLDGEEIMRLSGTAHNGNLIPGTGNQRIIYKALGNQTPSNQGGTMEFWTTPLNTTTLTKTATLSSTGIALESGKVLTGNVTGDVSGNVSGTAGSVAASNITGTTLASNVVTSSLTTVGTLGSLTVTGNITAGNVTATNYTGKVTHSIRDAGAVGGTTLTLNVTTDDIVRCTFTTDFTVAFSNIVAGRVVTLIATNTSGADTDVITSGVAALNTTSAGTFTVSPQTTAVITYYSLDGDVANIYVSAVYA